MRYPVRYRRCAPLKGISTPNVSALLLSLLLTAFCAIGLATACLLQGTQPFPTASATVAFATTVCLLAVCLNTATCTLFTAIEDRNAAPRSALSHALSLPARAGVLACCWLPYLALRFPGNIDEDSIAQIMQTYDLAAATDHHPWFDTALFGAFWHLGDFLGSHAWALCLFAVVQMVICAAVFAIVLRYLQQTLAAPRWFVRMCFAFFALYPAIPLFAQSMAKEMLFGWVWVLFLLAVCEIVRTRGSALQSKRMLLATMAVFCLLMLTKKTGVYLAAIAAVALFAYCNRDRMRQIAAYGIPLVLFALVWTHALLPLWNVSAGEERESLSVPIQQVACTVACQPGSVTAEERETIAAVIDQPDDLGTLYNPTRSDSVKDLWRSDATPVQKTAFLQLWATWLIAHPDTSFYALAANTLPFFYPAYNAPGYESYVFYMDKIPQKSGDQWTDFQEKLQTFADLGYGSTAPADVDGMLGDIYTSPDAAAVSSSFDAAYDQFARALWPLFNMALFASWIPLLVLFYALHAHRIDLAVCMVPTIAALMSLILGPTAIPRYIVPFVYATPLVAGLLFAPKPQPRTR